jgi:hypothetical protein
MMRVAAERHRSAGKGGRKGSADDDEILESSGTLLRSIAAGAAGTICS